MATAGTYTTPEGITRKLPKYWVRKDRTVSAGKLNSLGSTETIELELDLTTLTSGTPNYNVDRDNDGTLDGWSSNDPIFPANSSIVSTTVFTRTAAAGGTDIDIGLFQTDGTAIDADGLATVVLANMNTVGERYEGAGVLNTPATASVGANDAVIGITADGTFTAGKVQIVVEYVLN